MSALPSANSWAHDPSTDRWVAAPNPDHASAVAAAADMHEHEARFTERQVPASAEPTVKRPPGYTHKPNASRRYVWRRKGDTYVKAENAEYKPVVSGE